MDSKTKKILIIAIIPLVLMAGLIVLATVGIYWFLASKQKIDLGQGYFLEQTGATVYKRASSGILLQDGRVMVCGPVAERSDEHLPYCEIYNPETGQFELTRIFQQKILENQGVVLRDGRVLFPDLNDCKKTFIYEPKNGQVSLGPRMQSCKSHMKASLLLNDGTVLVIGGARTLEDKIIKNNPGIYQKESAEIYDPLKNEFKYVGEMTCPLSDLNAVLLSDGRVLVTGVLRQETSVTGCTQFYDPKARQFTKGPPMIQPRFNHTNVLLPDGRVLLAEGSSTPLGKYEDRSPNSSEKYIRSMEIYDPKLRKFLPGVEFQSVRYDFTAAHDAIRLPNNKVLYITPIGGKTRFEIYDPEINRFILQKELDIEAGAGYQRTLPLKNGKVLVLSSSGLFGNEYNWLLNVPKE